jgi:hypothetical protein
VRVVKSAHRAQNRISRRSPVLLIANIQVGGALVPIKLRNLSVEGALIEGDCLPAEGSVVCFRRRELKLKSRVVWVQGRYAGVAFARPLDPAEVLRYIPKSIAKPTTQIDSRRPGLACRPLTSYERRMMETWMTSSPRGAAGD